MRISLRRKIAMGWENCVENIKSIYGNAKEYKDVNWGKDVTQENLDNDDFATGKPFFLICRERHCVDNVSISIAEHAYCQCKDVNGNPIPDCTPKNLLEPIKARGCINIKTGDMSDKRSKTCTKQGDDWYDLTCLCCCSCFAYGTRIGIPSGSKVIEDFVEGDRVKTADVEPDGSGIKLTWSTAKVSFSSGTGPDSYESAMAYIRYGNFGTIIVSTDHLFLMPNGKLKRADRLVPGKDQLVSAEGVPVNINEVSIGEYKGGVHHIATDKEFTDNINGHLLLSEGVVSGDFNLQIHATELKEKYFVDDHDDLPKIGTLEYEKQNLHLASSNYASYQIAEANEVKVMPIPKPQKFYVHGENLAYIPETAARYLSYQQELDVNDNADKYSFTEANIGNAAVVYVLRLFKGFYPDIVFHHDVGRLEPNAYAFEQYGEQVVVISGGLTRIKGLGSEGIALILGHLISRLEKSNPLDDEGYTSIGMADYYSTVPMRTIFFGKLYQPVYSDGIKQIEDKIFSNINKEHDLYESDPYKPSTETRLDAIDAGDAMSFPPEGIGGPTWEGLKVNGAEAVRPKLNPRSFATEDIDLEMAEQVYRKLQEHKIMDDQGAITADFGLDTDLSFLFEDQPEKLKQLLSGEVRYVLLHSGAEVRVYFNMPVNDRTALDVDYYELEPEAKISGVAVSEDNSSVVVLTAQLQRDKEYILRVSRGVKASDGSTLDPKSDAAKFKMQ
jgi:hypothetical protein